MRPNIEFKGKRRKELGKLKTQESFMLARNGDMFYRLVSHQGDRPGLCIALAYYLKTRMIAYSLNIRQDTLVYPVELVEFDTKDMDRYVY